MVSVDAATTDATQVPRAEVSEAKARQVALGITARTHHVSASTLAAESRGRVLYDPAIVHTSDPLGPRPAWRFEVGNGNDVRETVLIGSDHGEVALHFNDAPGLDRRICDNANAHTVDGDTEVPICVNPARREGQNPVVSPVDVNQAYDNLGATSDAYAALDGQDLTALIGGTVDGTKSLLSTVRWCFSDDSCPYDNAFWDGRQMVFGAGYAKADDVVGHELTHGYVERTSALFYFHQSGAMNESLADTVGEIVDHRHGVDDDAAWNVGEDLNIPAAVRSMKDPTLHGQPDKMTSALYQADDFQSDGGEVHTNDGVGNKTAYLISQGGTFNGHTITGIDAGDPGLAKTGRLYLETIPRLTSGSEYADLGRVLLSTCQELATSATGGFTSADCDSVQAATAATQLSSPPAKAGAAAPEVAVACPTGGTLDATQLRDDDGFDDFGFDSSAGLWARLPLGDADPDWGPFPFTDVPANASSGKESLFALDPDPFEGDPALGDLTSAGFTVPNATGGAYLNFHHAYVMDYDGSTYYDGGRLAVQKQVNGTWTSVTGLPWVNGPTRHVKGSTSAGFTGFAGDSHGYGSSQVDLSSLAGQTVRLVFRVEGDPRYAFYGWWIDDVRLYSCSSTVPGRTAITGTAAAATTARVTWAAPLYPGAGIASYRLTRSDGRGVPAQSATTRSVTLSRISQTAGVTISVAAVTATGDVGAASSVRIYPTTTSITSSTTNAVKNRAFTVTGKTVRRGTSTTVASMPVLLQRRYPGGSWATASTGTTGSKGTKVWSVRQSRAAYYRVVSRGARAWLGSTSVTRTIRVH